MASRIYILLVFMLAVTQLSGQGQVLPGDANANGRVDHYDLLPIGYAYGHTGPSRLSESTNSPQDILELWPNAYPNGTNFIHADADGNGRVELQDFAVFAINQGLEDDVVEELAFFQGFSSTGAVISFNNGELIDPLTSATNLTIPVHILASAGASDLNGIAFEIEIDPAYVNAATFSFSDEWMNADNMAFPYIKYEDNKIQIAITRLGIDPVAPNGLIGQLSLIVVEDLVGIIPADLDTVLNFVAVNNILAVDETFSSSSVSSQGLSFGVLNSINSTTDPNDRLEASLAPNPVHNEIRLQTKASFTQVELFDLQGRQQLLYSGPPRTSWVSQLTSMPAGMYFLRLRGDQGHSVLRFIYSAE